MSVMFLNIGLKVFSVLKETAVDQYMISEWNKSISAFHIWISVFVFLDMKTFIFQN